MIYENSIFEEDIDKQLILLVLDKNLKIVKFNSLFLKTVGLTDGLQNRSINEFIDWEKTYTNKLKSRTPINNLKIILDNKLKYEKEFFCYLKNLEINNSYPVKFNYSYDENSKAFFLFGVKNNEIQTIVNELYCHLPFSTFAFDDDEKVVYLNDDLSAFGLKNRENYLNCSISKILSQKSHTIVQNQFEERNKSGNDHKNNDLQPVQIEIKDEEGNYHYTEAYLRTYLIENKRVVSGFLRCNQSQKQAIKKAFHVFDETPHPIYRYSYNALAKNKRDKFLFSYVNRAFEEVIGYKNEEIIGKSLFTIFLDKNFDEIYEKVYRRYKLEPIETSYSYYIKKKNGNKLHTVIHAVPFVFHGENPLFIQGALHDLTKEDKYREKLENANQNLDLMVSGVQFSNDSDSIDTFIREMFDTMIAVFEENWGVLYGIEDSENETKIIPIMSHNCVESEMTLPKKNYDTFKQLLSKCNNKLDDVQDIEIKKIILENIGWDCANMESNGIDIYAISFSSFDTPEFLFVYFSFSEFKLTSIDKSTISYLSNVVVNRLERERNERESRLILNSMESSSKQITLGEISWEITHEVGNTVNNLASSIAALYENPIIESNQELNVQITELKDLIEDAIEIVTKHRTWYNPSSQIEIFNPNKRLDEIIDVFKKKRRIKSKKIKLTYKPGKFFPLKMVKVRFSEICFNLILNSYQAIPEKKKGHIHVSTGISGESFFVKIVDDGIGIKKQDMDKIFDKYSTKKNGTGLGLYVSKRFAEEVKSESGVKGQIEVKPNSVGSGVAFTVHLPKGLDNE